MLFKIKRRGLETQHTNHFRQ